ncbi:MAG: DUF5719 family protein [Microbacteriaceae bacterium]
MATRRGIALGGVRVLTGLAGLAVAALCIGAAMLLPLPEYLASVPSMTVSPQPTSQQRACPGPLLALASDSADATKASSFGPTAVVAGAEHGAPTASVLKAPGDVSAAQNGAPSLLTVPAAADSDRAPLIAGSQSQSAALEDLAGFAASGCGEASGDSWIVAGATTLGETSLVRLTNSTQVVATVNLDVYGPDGVVKAPAAAGIIVAPMTQLTVPLAGLAPELQSPVIHVQSRGGRVLASLQQSVVRGLDPGGVEVAGPTTAPGTTQVIPGVVISSLAALQVGNSSESYSEVLPAVRVLVPGTKSARVTVDAVKDGASTTGAGTTGAAPSTPSAAATTITVKPGVSTEIPLDKVSDGTYTVTVTANLPVVAAARTSTMSAAGKDFAWFAAAKAFTGDFLVAVAPGPSPTLHLVNTATTDASLTLRPATGAAKTVSVPAGASVSVPVAARASYTASGAQSVLASVSYLGDGTVSAFTLAPASALADPITVYLR